MVVDRKLQPLEVVDNVIKLEDILADSVVSIMVPHSDTSAFQAMVRDKCYLVCHMYSNLRQKILTEVDYTTAPEPSVSRTIRMMRVVLTALPISVNVEDFFRGTRYCLRSPRSCYPY